jgi:hypothetical protein
LTAFAVPTWGDDGKTVRVADDAALRQALNDAKPGWRIVIAQGTYRPGVWVRGLRGTAEAPIVLEGVDQKDPPAFEGGQVGLHFADCAYLTIRHLAVRGQSGNGINLDDGGSFDTPAHHITLENLHVSDVGPTGNRDGIKLSGVDDLIVRDCVIDGWGGQAIDMVGCHRALIEGCTFRGKAGFSQETGPQAKGGSSQVVIRRCDFVNAGQRGVNLGGSTALKVFRPPGATYEANDVTVEGCRFVGSLAPVAFVGVDGATVRYNTFYHPDKWVVRVLQETTADGFVPCRNGRFEHNLVVFRRDRLQTAVNVGRGTEPATFSFRDNLWYCEDAPARSRPDLPVAEQGGVSGVDPLVTIGPVGLPAAPAA